MIQKFRKKPVVIDALQYDGSNSIEVEGFSEGQIVKRGGKSDEMDVKSLEGNVIAVTGDWIIKGVNGEFYPCKPDIFEKTYELVK